MHRSLRSWRGYFAALSVGACLGCGTPAAHVSPLPQPGLGADAEQRAAALAHFAAGISLLHNQGVAAALPEYRQAFDLDPANVGLAMMCAELYRSQRDATNALQVMDTAIQAAPKAGEPWVAKGLTYRAIDDTSNSAVCFQRALQIEPSHPGALQALTETYLLLNNTNALVTLLEQSYRRSVPDVSYWTTLGDAYQAVLRHKPSLDGRLDRGRIRQCYDKAIGLAPDNVDLLWQFGNACLDGGDYKAAAGAYEKVRLKRPNLPQLRERLAATYVKTEQKEKAIALYQELVKREPLRYELYNLLGELFEELGKLEEALEYFRQSLALNPDQPDTYLSVAETQHRLKRADAMQQTLAAWKKKFPTDWKIPFFNAIIFTDQKEFTKAIAAYADAETLADESPQEVHLNAQFYFGYGAVAERAGDYVRAGTLFRKVIALNPKSAGAYNYLGYMWADQGTNLTEALEFIQKANDLEPNNGAYRDSLGWVLHKLGRDAEALPHLQRAVELLEKDLSRDKEERREDAIVYDHLAEVLLKAGNRAEAIRQWQRARELDPDNKDIAGKASHFAP